MTDSGSSSPTRFDRGMLRQRQIINVAALTTLGFAAPQLRFHIDGALNVGVSATEIVEVIMQMSVYAGFPAALNGLAVAKAAFADRPETGNLLQESTVQPEETSQQRYERGMDAIGRVNGASGEEVMGSLAHIAPELGGFIAEFAFGDIWTRPGLEVKSRELATGASLTTQGTALAQLRIHLHGFLNVGGTREEAVETIIQLAGYAGFPAALNGIAAAREVFAARETADQHQSCGSARA